MTDTALDSNWEADDGFNADDATKFAAAFTAHGWSVSARAVADWYDGDNNAVNEAVMELLGPKTFEFYSCAARLVPAVACRLGIWEGSNSMCGGVDLSLDLDVDDSD